MDANLLERVADCHHPSESKVDCTVNREFDMSSEDVIANWFRYQGVGSVQLPDGWYGQPYDNQHRLTSVQRKSGVLVVELASPDLILTFSGPVTVASADMQIEIDGFCLLVVTAPQASSKSYYFGQVIIARPPG